MKCFALAGIVSVCTLVAQPAARPAPGMGSVEGHVVNALTNAPVRKAIVTLIDSPVSLTAETNAEGWFQFTALPPGTYKLSAARPGFLARAAGRAIVLGSNGAVTDAEIRLAPQGVLSGRVLDEDDDPVAGANLFVLKQAYRDGRKTWVTLNNGARTNDIGEYRVPNLSPGRYLVKATAQPQLMLNRYPDGRPGGTPRMEYVPAYYPNAPSEQTASPVELGVGMEVHGIDIHLAKSVKPASIHVRGKVIGMRPDSQPIVTVWLEAAERSSFNWFATVQMTDYTFDTEAPQPGQYRLFAFVESGGPSGFATSSVTVSENVPAVTLAMGTPLSLTGRLSVAETGSNVNLASVRTYLLRYPSRNITPVATSDAAGKLVFANIPPGHYSIEVDPGTIPDGCFIQALELSGQQVSPNDFELLNSAEIEIVLSHTAGTISGSVTEDDGKPVPLSKVTLIPLAAKSQPAKQMADDKGNFKFTNLAPGKYQLFAWADVDDDLWPDPEFREKYDSGAVEINLDASQTQTARLRAIEAEESK